MLITCGNCSARYDLPEGSIGAAGRLLKCSVCSNEWTEYPQGINLRGEKNINDVPKTMALQAIPDAPQSSDFTLKLFTIALALVLIPLTTLYMFSTQNKFAGFFDKLHINNSDGLAFSNIEFRKIKKDAEYIMVIKGELKNNSSQPVKFDGIKIKVTDKNDKKITRLIYENARGIINAGEVIKFEPKIGNVPETASKIHVDIGNKLEMLFR